MPAATKPRSTNRKDAPVPQPTTPPVAPDLDQDDGDAAADAAAWAEIVDSATEGDSSGARQVKRAIELEADRAKLMKQISDNREYLRLMDRNDELSEDQTEFLEVFYPEKERGSRREKADIEATRKAREAARNGTTN
jgi:hypothetical protein